MAETWNKENCPLCNAPNWLPQLSEEDIASYTCWSCGKDIQMFVGEFGDVYSPHEDGTNESDEQDHGLHWDGQEKP